MKKIFSTILALGMGFLAFSNVSVDAKGNNRSRKTCYVTSHIRKITTNKKGTKYTRSVRVKGHTRHIKKHRSR